MVIKPNHMHLTSTSAYIKAVETSAVINHKSHKDANASTQRKESNEEKLVHRFLI